MFCFNFCLFFLLIVLWNLSPEMEVVCTGGHDIKWLGCLCWLWWLVVIMIRILTILASNSCGDDGFLQITKPPPRVFLANNGIG